MTASLSLDRLENIAALLFIAGALPLILLGKYRDYQEPIDDESDVKL